MIGWERVKDRFYRVRECYSLSWRDIDLDDYMIAMSPFGSSIALYKLESRVREYKHSDIKSSGISIFSSYGKLIYQINWNQLSNGKIASIGFTDNEHLFIVKQDGTIREYIDFEGNFNEFSLGPEAESNGIVDCRFWGNGLVALLSNNRFVTVTNFDEPRPKLLAELPVLSSNKGKETAISTNTETAAKNLEQIHGWTVILPEDTLNQTIEVIVSYGKTVVIVDTAIAVDQLFQEGPFEFISSSPNGGFVSLYSSKAGTSWVISADFQRKLSEYRSDTNDIPTNLSWCGNDAIVIAWQDELRLIGPDNAIATFYYDTNITISAEIDGVRILTNDKLEFLSRVSNITVEAFRIGSTAPSAVLLDCIDQIDRHSPKADENLQLIKHQLVSAVNNCIRAAGEEFDTYFQKKLLRAALFGKSALELYNGDEFVEMCQSLRVLNAVRQFDVGIFITYAEYIKLTPDGLIDRLLMRQQHLVAFKISEYLNLPTDSIYIHWACCKIRHPKTETDESLAKIISEKLSKNRGISYETIAKTAYQEGRARLATLLINFEPRPNKQVPLLLDMEEDEIALIKACASEDSDLILYVLILLLRKLSLGQFFKLISGKPAATNLFESFIKTNITFSDHLSNSESTEFTGEVGINDVDKSFKLLNDFYYQEDRKLELENLYLKESFDTIDVNDKIKGLRTTHKSYMELKSIRPDLLPDAKSLDENIKLITLQKQLETEYEREFLNKSLVDTIYNLIFIGQGSRANKVKSEFKLSEKRFYWIKLRALVARRQWDELQEWAKSKKSPIGYEPFYYQCLAAGSKRCAEFFLPMCPKLQLEM